FHSLITSSSLSILGILFVLVTIGGAFSANRCPDKDVVYPCVCNDNVHNMNKFSAITIVCSGKDGEEVEEAMNKIRSHLAAGTLINNNLSLVLEKPKMKELPPNAFIGLNFNSLTISNDNSSMQM